MTDYWCGPGGNNGNDGLSRANYKATYAAIITAYSPGAGDTVYLTASTGAGASGTITERLEVQSGTSGSYFTIAVADDDAILVDASTPGNAGAVHGSGKSWFRIVPGNGSLELGDTNDWSVGNYDGYSADQQIDFVNCSNFELIGTGTGVLSTTDSNFKIHGGGSYTGNVIDEDCTMYRVSGVDFSRHGTNDTENYPSTTGQPGQDNADWGDMISIEGTRGRIDFCTFTEGGHDNLQQIGHYNLIEFCQLNGTPAPGTASAGLRCMNLLSGNTSGNRGVTPYGPNIVQGCILSNADQSDQSDQAATKLEGNHVIFRGNYIWDCIDRIWQCNPNSDHVQSGAIGTVSRIKVYHNTGYAIGSIGSWRTIGLAEDNDDMFVYCDIVNNVFDAMGTPVFGRPYVWREATNEPTDGFGDDGWKGARIDGNLVNTAAGGAVDCEFRPISGGVETFNFSAGDDDYPTIWGSANAKVSPSYSGTPGFPSFDRTKSAFRPNGGPETGNAVPLATANGAVTNGNTITLQDGQAYLFKDDWGMSSLGVTGDYVYLAEIDAIRQITSIDYANHQITIDGGTVVLSDNSQIYWVLEDGVTKCQDIGAGQTLAVVDPPPPPPDGPKVTTPVVWVHR